MLLILRQKQHNPAPFRKIPGAIFSTRYTKKDHI
jgi:hypothetical protein